MKLLEYSSGIYCIFTADNDPLYIGSALDVKKRFHSEKTLLERNMHDCTELQAYYNQDPDLRFVPVYYCHEKKLDFNKFKFIMAFQPAFNFTPKKFLLEAGEVPQVVKLLAQQFAGQCASMDEIQKFLNEQDESVNTVTLGKLIHQHRIASKERNWSERGKQYYRFR